MNSEGFVNWSVFSCSQNLPAILNDPKRGKQKDFFTKTWGESFVEQTVIPPSPLLEDVPNSYFATYYKKLLKRNKKYRDRKASGPGAIVGSVGQRDDSIHNLFPQFGLKDSSQLLKSEANPIPKIFFSQGFSLSNSETFREVFTVGGNGLPSKLSQDKLSHYLDLIEVGLAQQISKKSSAFFSAVSTQDKVAEKVTRAIDVVKKIKNDLVEVKNNDVITPFTIVKLQKRKTNYLLLHRKLQLMSTIHQAQRAIQSLLGNSDYVGALDLISTTQVVLLQELQGLVSFRHLDSQLVEIRGAIEKMLRAELERNLSADLNRPVEQVSVFCDKDRLISIIFGHFRLGKIAAVIAVLAKEISTAMTTTCKQTLIEAISESDSKTDSLINSNSFQGIIQLPSELWIKMITQLGNRLVLLMEHIRDLILLFQNCADSAIGRSSETSVTSAFLQLDGEESLITEDLFNNFSSELATQLERTTENADEKFTGMMRFRKTYLIKNEALTTLEVVKHFTSQLNKFANSLHPDTIKSLKFKCILEMKVQITEFVRNFHLKQTENINAALDREKWKVVNEEKVKQTWPIIRIKRMMEIKSQASLEDSALTQTNNNNSVNECPNDNHTVINGCEQEEIVLTAEVFYIILDAVAEYCQLFILTGTAEVVLGVVELLRVANARMAHLILGAGAVELKVCKSITVTILVVVLRGLNLIADSMEEVKDIFDNHLLTAKSQHVLKQISAVHQEYFRHADSVENKMLSILEDIIDLELTSWEARPPVPSTPISNVSRNIVKFREAIGSILDDKQISTLFIKIDKIFRTKLKQRIAALGIRKDGGPRQGVVTSEMMHYADSIRKLNILPPSITSNSRLTNDLWS